MFKSKKGIQLNQAFMAVLTLVLLGVLVIVSIVLFASLQTTTLTLNTAGTAVNESVTVSTSGVNLSAVNLVAGSCGTITSVINGSNYAINSGNYTQTGCLLQNKTSLNQLSTSWKVTYPYTYSSATGASNASSSMIDNFSTYPALVGLTGTIIFLGIVIGVLVSSFVFGGTNKA